MPDMALERAKLVLRDLSQKFDARSCELAGTLDALTAGAFAAAYLHAVKVIEDSEEMEAK